MRGAERSAGALGATPPKPPSRTGPSQLRSRAPATSLPPSPRSLLSFLATSSSPPLPPLLTPCVEDHDTAKDRSLRSSRVAKLPGRPERTDGVDLVDEDYARHLRLGGREELADTSRSDAHEHLVKLRAGPGCGEKRKRASLAGNGGGGDRPRARRKRPPSPPAKRRRDSSLRQPAKRLRGPSSCTGRPSHRRTCRRTERPPLRRRRVPAKSFPCLRRERRRGSNAALLRGEQTTVQSSIAAG